MDYIKLYILTHLKFWWIYLISIVTLFVAYIVSLIFVLVLSHNGVADEVSMIIGSLLCGIIGSIPIMYVNYLVAKQSFKSKEIVKSKLITLLIFNQLPTVIVYIGLFWLVLFL